MIAKLSVTCVLEDGCRGRGRVDPQIGSIRNRSEINLKFSAIEGLCTSSHFCKFHPDRSNSCLTNYDA